MNAHVVIVRIIDPTASIAPDCSFKSEMVNLSTGNLSKVILFNTPNQNIGYHKNTLLKYEIFTLVSPIFDGSDNVLFADTCHNTYKMQHDGKNLSNATDNKWAKSVILFGSTSTGGSVAKQIVQNPQILIVQ